MKEDNIDYIDFFLKCEAVQSEIRYKKYKKYINFNP